MATSTKSYCGRWKRKKKSSKEEFFLEDSDDEEPPTKKLKIEQAKDRQPVSTDTPEKNVTEALKSEVNTPAKSDLESPPSVSVSKSLCDLQSPDSAYYSCTEKSPFCRLPSSVGESSGIGIDCCDTGAQTGTDVDREPREDSADNSNTDRVIDFLHENFSMLKEEMDPDGLADYLHESGIINKLTVEKIGEEKHRLSRCDILIKAIARCRDIRKPSTERKLRRAFEAEKSSHLLKNLGKGKSDPLHGLGKFDMVEMTSKLRLLEKEIEDNLEPRHIIDDLVTLRMLTLDEHDEILVIVPRSKRVQLLIHFVLKDMEANFPKFYDSVKKEYPDLGKKLVQKDNIKSTSDEIEPNKPKVKIEAKVNLAPPRMGTVKGKREETLHVKFNIPDQRELEQMIVDQCNLDSPQPLDEQAMDVGYFVEDVEFSSIKVKLTKLSQMSQLRFYKKCIQSPQFLQEWVQKLLSQEHLKKLKATGISALEVEIHIQKPSSVECLCQLTKKCIVAHFSHIEKSLKSLDDILREFSNFSQFSEEARKSFDIIRRKKDGLVESFLWKLLEMEDVAICLFQQELIRTDQRKLLDAIINTTASKEKQSYKISLTSFKKGFSLLLDEIEPRKFIGMLQKLPNNETVSEYVMSEEGRRLRCKKFLDIICREGQTAVDQFVQALEAENKSHILDMLSTFEQKIHGNEGLQLERSKDAVIQNLGKIVDEVDVRNLREVFIERKIIKARMFDSLCKHPSRQTRTSNLLRYILMQEEDMLTCFMYALETKGYDKLVSDILKEKDSYKPCPRLEMGDGDVVVFKGTCHLKFSIEPVTESPLQLELHRRLYRRIDKDSYTRKWLDHLPEESVSRQPIKRRHGSVDSKYPYGIDDLELPAKQLFMDTDASSTNGSIFRCHDEAYDRSSQTVLGTSSPTSSLPNSPGTDIYEEISPPSSPTSKVMVTFDANNDYHIALSLQEAKDMKLSAAEGSSGSAGPSGVCSNMAIDFN